MNRFKNILCVVAEGCANDLALARAATLAAQNQARLIALKVIDEIPPNTKLWDRTLFPEIKEKILAQETADLDTLVAPWNDKAPITSKVVAGVLFLEVIREVLRSDIDLVIKATENDSFLKRVFGSDDMHLTRKCPCPVWLANSASDKPVERIVAAIDVDDCYREEEIDTRRGLNRFILQVASSLAHRENAALHIVHVLRQFNESLVRAGMGDAPGQDVSTLIEAAQQRQRDGLKALMDARVAELDQEVLAAIKPEIHWLEGFPQEEIATFSNSLPSDLLIMGTVARTGIPGLFMGNTAEAIQNRIDCSLLAVKPEGFVSPVTIEEE